MKKVIVIGGGASGLTAAITSARSGADVMILEKNSNCAKKILITGNGRCNYFNEDMNLSHFNTNSNADLSKLINYDNLLKVAEFFESIGVIPKIKNGYYYPMSNQAISISNALINEAKILNVNIRCNINVVDIVKEKNQFIIKTDYEDFSCDKVILATGSKAAPKTGSDGFGYELLRNLGHKIIKPLPALVQLKSDDKITKLWDGVRCDSVVSLYINGDIVKSEIGEVMLTSYGLSGICIFNLSGLTARALEESKKVKVHINFLPFIESENKLEWFNNLNKNVPDRTISELLDNLLNYKLVNALLKNAKIDNDSFWGYLSDLEKEMLIKNLTDFEIEINGTNSFDNAQVCSGGLDLNEVNLDTMESKIVSGLYVTGELLDIDGDCGGYNLTNAWITGIIAGENVKND